MKRRTVLKLLAAFPIAGTTVLYRPRVEDCFTIADNCIKYVGPKHGSFTINELYQWLSKELGNLIDEGGVRQLTNELIVLNDLSLDEDSAPHLRDGSVVSEDGTVYSSHMEMGRFDDHLAVD